MSRDPQPDPSPPLVSVVMVCRGAAELTRRSLAALAASTEVSYEVILVDDASDAPTRAALAELTGPRVVWNSAYQGFGPANNRAAALAEGRYLLLLNTDAFLHAGWFEAMAAALERDGVGAVVPKLLNQDGSLQEAGALLARDGRVIVYGDGEDPDDPRFTFSRYVDTASAAVMLIRRDLFLELGGFDERYAPAYYEDADLCMRIAEHGRRVLYEPTATATHVRYGSGGREQAVVLSERNRGRFAQRWGETLAARPRSFAQPTPQAAFTSRDAGAWPHMLALTVPGKSTREPAWDPPDLTETLLGYWPDARLSWASDGTTGPGRQLDPRVESIPLTGHGWLDDRLFHYDVILMDGVPDPATSAVLDRTQPQAARVDLSDLRHATDEQLLRAFARAGILRLARASRTAAA